MARRRYAARRRVAARPAAPPGPSATQPSKRRATPCWKRSRRERSTGSRTRRRRPRAIR